MAGMKPEVIEPDVPEGLRQTELIRAASENGYSMEKAHEYAWDKMLGEGRNPQRRCYHSSWEKGQKAWQHKRYLFYKELQERMENS